MVMPVQAWLFLGVVVCIWFSLASRKPKAARIALQISYLLLGVASILSAHVLNHYLGWLMIAYSAFGFFLILSGRENAGRERYLQTRAALIEKRQARLDERNK